MKQETLNKYLNTTHGVLTILELDHEEYDKLTQCKRSYFKCKCNRCGSITVVRTDRFGKGKYIPKSCSNCISDLQKEIADKKYKEDRPERHRINSIRSNAKSRNYKIELTNAEIKELLHKPCFYCGEENANGIDRVDSTKHYTKENCVPCCFICNRMKNKYSINVFLEKIKQIYHNHNESSTTISKESTLQANGSGNGELLTAYLR
jgi:hypothetical protein